MMANAFRTVVLALPLTLMAAPASQVGAHGWLGGEKGFLQFEFGEYRYPEPAWAAGGISCRVGWKIVRTRGFRDVRPLECRGRTFTYLAWWRGDRLTVYVNSATGRILGARPG
jgi:hypothetical protein